MLVGRKVATVTVSTVADALDWTVELCGASLPVGKRARHGTRTAFEHLHHALPARALRFAACFADAGHHPDLGAAKAVYPRCMGLAPAAGRPGLPQLEPTEPSRHTSQRGRIIRFTAIGPLTRTLVGRHGAGYSLAPRPVCLLAMT